MNASLRYYAVANRRPSLAPLRVGAQLHQFDMRQSFIAHVRNTCNCWIRPHDLQRPQALADWPRSAASTAVRPSTYLGRAHRGERDGYCMRRLRAYFPMVMGFGGAVKHWSLRSNVHVHVT